MNQQYIHALPIERLSEQARTFLQDSPYADVEETKLRKMLSAVQTKLVRLTDVPAHLEQFFRDDEAPIPPDSEAKLTTEEARRAFADFRQRLEGLEALNSDNFRELMKAVAKHTGVKGKSLWEPMRIALTRDTSGPDLALFVDVLGKQTILNRIDRALGQ